MMMPDPASDSSRRGGTVWGTSDCVWSVTRLFRLIDPSNTKRVVQGENWALIGRGRALITVDSDGSNDDAEQHQRRVALFRCQHHLRVRLTVARSGSNLMQRLIRFIIRFLDAAE